MILWAPHPNMQTELLEATEFECFAGGAAGPGKSDALLVAGLLYTHISTYRALILRASFPELRELMDRAHEIFPSLGAVWTESEKRWTFPSGATYEFGYCSTFADVQRYRGQEYGFIGFDEIGDLAEMRTWTFLMTRCRSKDLRVRPRMRCTANPGGIAHPWLRKRYIDPCGKNGERVYTDPKTGLTRRFIPGRVLENPTLLANNPQYIAQLRAQPEMIRRQLEEGDWDAGTGAALDELSEDKHIVPWFEVPDHWKRTIWGAFDWGFRHPFAFGVFCTDEDGGVWLLDSVHGRQLLDLEIVDRIKESLEPEGLVPRISVAGHDAWHDIKARTERGPTTAETFAKHGVPLVKAEISRVAGLKNVRNYLAWRSREDETPRFRMRDTPGNRKVFETMENMVVDPDNMEDVLKVDADSDGEGGDDAFDAIRYGLMRRPMIARKPEEAKKANRNHDPVFDKMMKMAQRAQRGR